MSQAKSHDLVRTCTAGCFTICPIPIVLQAHLSNDDYLDLIATLGQIEPGRCS
jgi:hypothetical protein